MNLVDELDSSAVKESNKKPLIRCKSSLLRTIKLPRDLKVAFYFIFLISKDINCNPPGTKLQKGC